MMNNNSKKYYRDLKGFLPIYGRKELHLYRDIKNRLNELTANNPDISYDELCDKLGSPLEIVNEYYSSSDVLYLAKRLRFTRYIRNAFICIIIFLLMLTNIRAYYLQQALNTVADENVVYEQEIIE